jgi:hypothetical protein
VHYIAYIARTIHILKCEKCRSYELKLIRDKLGGLDEKSRRQRFTCLNCGNDGETEISGKYRVEEFDSWDSLQDRIDALKAAMSLRELE